MGHPEGLSVTLATRDKVLISQGVVPPTRQRAGCGRTRAESPTCASVPRVTPAFGAAMLSAAIGGAPSRPVSGANHRHGWRSKMNTTRAATGHLPWAPPAQKDWKATSAPAVCRGAEALEIVRQRQRARDSDIVRQATRSRRRG